MEAIKGTVSNIQRDVSVIQHSDSESNRPGTTDITNFQLAGRTMQFRSSRPTYNSMSDGDVIVAGGKQKGPVFQVLVFRNLTKNLNSYQGQSLAMPRIGAALLFLSATFTSAIFYFMGASLIVPLSVFIFCLGISIFILYLDFRYRKAIKLIENFG